jgi:signal transduction histidine kinase
MMVVPIVARETVHGVFTFISTDAGRRHSGSSLATAHDLAAHAALAIDNALFYERAQKAIHAREDMLSFVSHDLRNPLMGIQLTTETLMRNVPAEERRKGWKQLERIKRGARQMRRMIDDLLDVTSLEAGRLTLTTDAHEAARLADEAVVMLAPLAVEKQVKLAYQPSRQPLVIRADRDRVIQVLSNLIGNAIKFTPQGGAVTVTTGAADTRALFAVSDNGPGISPAVRPHIFERFWQAEETARKGRGLGLYIAKGLVEAQGGAIWVDSPGEGGTRFSFTLPLASAAEVDRFRATMEATRGSLGDSPVVGPG